MYDPKINRAKGIEAGTAAAVVSASTSLMIVIIDHVMPNLSDSEVTTVATAIAILASAGVAAIIKMHTNKVKHG